MKALEDHKVTVNIRHHNMALMLMGLNFSLQDHVVHCEMKLVECPNSCGLFVVRIQVGNKFIMVTNYEH